MSDSDVHLGLETSYTRDQQAQFVSFKNNKRKCLCDAQLRKARGSVLACLRRLVTELVHRVVVRVPVSLESGVSSDTSAGRSSDACDALPGRAAPCMRLNLMGQ